MEHVAQGVTQHRAIFHIRAPQIEGEYKQEKALQAMAKVFGARSFYVGATRASHELRIYINDKQAAALAVAARQEKTSAIEAIQHQKQAQLTRETQPQTIQKKHELQR